MLQSNVTFGITLSSRHIWCCVCASLL